jgi:phosphoribosylaminoimidazolecarboxamide formyltransferase/IMP cyclohydrolase
MTYTGTWSGLLVQVDSLPPVPDLSSGEWIGTPREDLWEDLLFAWKIAALSKSNAIAVVKDGSAVGIGRGFCSRLHAVDFAVRQAGEKCRGAVLASDAFFPFSDGIQSAVDAGVAAIIQPGGSIKDEEVFAATRELGISMFISGHRTFRH